MNKNQHIGVIGGGTAGYLTALTVSKLLPGTKVTILESSKIPIIGVGESTTPKLLRMLHDVLGFDLSEFYREVRPTWKLGVRYLWGASQFGFSNSALGVMNPFVSVDVANNINYNSLNSVLIDNEKSFIMRTGNPEKPYKSLALPTSYAYHMDNERLSCYLKKKSKEWGIDIIDTKIVDATREESGDLSSIKAEDGTAFSFDFYVDCTGFKSVLLGGAMESPFQEYKKSLYTDTALTGYAPNNGRIKSCTEARTMKHGWQWNIPQHHEDHIGYVHSSAFVDLDQAEKEMRDLNPGLGDVRTIRFRSGRHRDFVKGNVAAVGNAYGFIEALQSTALHMVITNVYALVLHLKNREKGLDVSEKTNANLGEIWDRLRWFIAMHFKFNKRLSTDFWKACNADIDISGAEELLELYREKGPLYVAKKEDDSLKKADEYQIYGLFSHDFMLMIHDFMPKKPPFTLGEQERKHYKGRYSIWDQLAEKALYQHEVLDEVEANPGIVEFDAFFEQPFILKGEFDLFDEANIANFIVRS